VSGLGFAGREKSELRFVSSAGWFGCGDLSHNCSALSADVESGGEIDLAVHYCKHGRFFFLANAARWLMGLSCKLTFIPIKASWEGKASSESLGSGNEKPQMTKWHRVPVGSGVL